MTSYAALWPQSDPRIATCARAFLLLLASFLLLISACRGPDAPGRVIVLGIDGLDPDVVELLIAEGKLPNFERLREGGTSGRLLSTQPLLSPIIWTTIATGQTPDRHKIAHFVAVNEKTGAQLPVTSSMRKTKALWNILSDHGKTVDVVGWWATWPAESVNGTIVSDHTCYHFLFQEGQEGPREAVGVIHPPDREAEIRELVRRPQSLTHDELSRFASVSPEEFARPFNFDDPLGHFKWALATADSYARIGLHLWQQDRPDVLMVYIEGVDSSSHLFGHLFRSQGLAGELAEQQARYGMTVERMYEYADEIVGEYLEAMDEDTTLLVVSDHGFQLGVLHDDPSRTRDMRRVSERFHRIEGVFYAFGKRVIPGRWQTNPELLDVTPTVLALAGITPAMDMQGKVLLAALSGAARTRTRASFEGSAHAGAPNEVGSGDELGSAAEGADPNARDSRVDAAIVERLEQLGYLGTVSPHGARNLAGGLFEAGRHEEAAEAYAKLVAEDPDDASLRASYGGALGVLGLYPEALSELGRAVELDPLNVEARHNRGLIYERQGELDKALDEYRNALRYRADYPPSRAAFERLGGSALRAVPASPEEEMARRLAEQASITARRGDYAAAMAQLDEAEALASDFALVYQYRANVAFLKGDTGAAVAALERALELEPDNALYRANLARLVEQSEARGSGSDAPPAEGEQ